jgi:alkyl hydroperoxide reductase subunit AhpF
MAFLKESDAEYLRGQLAQLLTRPVTLRLFTEPVSGLYVPGRRTCESCPDAEALMNEVAALSDRIQLEVVNVATQPEVAREWGVNLTPTISISADGGAADGVRFVGLPDGYEFTSFVETLVSAGSQPGHGLQAETAQELASLTTDVDIKTFVTPT